MRSASARSVSSRIAAKAMVSPTVSVCLEAVCLCDGDAVASLMKVEEQMCVGPILAAATLADALGYFLSNSDVVMQISDVRSFKVNGHEFINTFLR